ncbi:uncharacterized protein ALTATR162_LOCUS11302 [Alternaria atra]|uniref:Amino acid permease/ SLC12A domain-containing protein n=1 Tax=Alternaria atra TaxID=119953 RepID=A0A8J2N525_9PLEO|nr:uncharacterized protein ALTATR162_LOCUS11302 [Alternaria atra]CAG5185427.1 unnamed protein product [Alternaria atra]
MASASEEITPKMDQRSDKSVPHSASDVEKQAAAPKDELQRKLSSRHLQFVAIGGTVGTGVFIASGGSIATAGPAGALLAYVFVGTLVYSVMLSLAEMATYLPISGAFTQYAARFVDPSLGFSMGWIYWFSWSITYALELTAAGLIIQWWDSDLSIGIFITIFWVPITAVNFLPVDIFGEFEFWFALIKVVALVGFWIYAICMNAGVGAQGYIGFKYWDSPGAFAPYLAEGAVAKFVGFWAVLIQAGFAYQVTAAMGLLAYMNLSSNGGEAFNWLLNIVSVAGFIAWTCVLVCHLSFMRALKAQNIDRDTLPFKSWGGRPLAIYGVTFCAIITITQGFTAFVPWSTEDFFIAYISLILFAVLYLGHKIVTRSKFINPAEADLLTGKFEDEESETWEESSASGWKKFMNKFL